MKTKMRDLTNKTIVISRTDSIGDVMLTLPMCVWIKQHYPSAKIVFLANEYTHPVLRCLPQIDDVILWNDLEKLPQQEQINQLKAKKTDVFIHVFPRKTIAYLAKKAGIAIRVGTLNRLFHLLTCNIRCHFSRARSDFHEAQLNFELLKPFGVKTLPALTELSQWMTSFTASDCELPVMITDALIKPGKKVILHPKSQGSAKEWPIENYITLAKSLLEAGCTVFFSGTEKEGALFRKLIPHHDNCIDTTGKLTLTQLIRLISLSDALVACSTGPLHIAGALGIHAVGLYSPRRPVHPGRWQPLGRNVHILVKDEQCQKCQKQQACSCIEEISPQSVFELIHSL